MKIAVVKYNAGNTQSVTNALERLGIAPVVTDAAEELRAADKVIFPGVGEASTAMNYLRARRLDEVIKSLTQPVLGICLGMQLFGAFSDENETVCLGIVPARAHRFDSADLKVPHIGWNNLTALQSPLFANIAENEFVYFVHAYYMETGAATIATTKYGVPFSAAIQYNNFYGVQFHPEKSGAVGAQILENFITPNDALKDNVCPFAIFCVFISLRSLRLQSLRSLHLIVWGRSRRIPEDFKRRGCRVFRKERRGLRFTMAIGNF